MRFRVPLTLSAVAILAVGCGQSPSVGISEADKAAIEAQEQLFAKAMTGNDVATVMKSYYAPDAMLFAPNAPLASGSAAVEAVLKSFPPLTAVTLKADEIVGYGDLAYVRGKYTMTTATGTDSGKYLEIYRKQADGTWKNSRDSFSSDMPMPMPMPMPAPAPAKQK